MAPVYTRRSRTWDAFWETRFRGNAAGCGIGPMIDEARRAFDRAWRPWLHYCWGSQIDEADDEDFHIYGIHEPDDAPPGTFCLDIPVFRDHRYLARSYDVAVVAVEPRPDPRFGPTGIEEEGTVVFTTADRYLLAWRRSPGNGRSDQRGDAPPYAFPVAELHAERERLGLQVATDG